MRLMKENSRRRGIMKTTKELYMGADLMREKANSQFLSLVAHSLWRRGDNSELKKFVSSLPGKKHIGIEATGFVYPIYDSLVETGADVTVANPNRIRLIAESRTKHDRVDARSYRRIAAHQFLSEITHPS